MSAKRVKWEIPICKICNELADYGSLCNRCRDKIKMERRKAKKK